MFGEKRGILKRRGLSPIVATILLVLIAVAISGIVWISVRSYLGGQVKELSGDCTQADVSIDIDSGVTCYDGLTKSVVLKLNKGPSAINISKISFVFYFQEKEKTNIQLGEFDSNIPKTYMFNMSGFSYGDVKRVSIAPIIGKQTCKLGAPVDIKICSGVLTTSQTTGYIKIGSSGGGGGGSSSLGTGWVCGSDSDCTPNKCQGGVCVCVPSCEGKSCGDDGCGGSCGSCGGGEVCISSGQCCTPSTCSSLGMNCDIIDDGCGNMLDCGSCDSGKICHSGICGCATCSDSLILIRRQQTICGQPYSDNCGNVCGTGTYCTYPKYCMSGTCRS